MVFFGQHSARGPSSNPTANKPSPSAGPSAPDLEGNPLNRKYDIFALDWYRDFHFFAFYNSSAFASPPVSFTYIFSNKSIKSPKHFDESFIFKAFPSLSLPTSHNNFMGGKKIFQTPCFEGSIPLKWGYLHPSAVARLRWQKRHFGYIWHSPGRSRARKRAQGGFN